MGERREMRVAAAEIKSTASYFAPAHSLSCAVVSPPLLVGDPSPRYHSHPPPSLHPLSTPISYVRSVCQFNFNFQFQFKELYWHGKRTFTLPKRVVNTIKCRTMSF